MNQRSGQKPITILVLLLLAGALLVACGESGAPLPTLVPTAEDLPPTATARPAAPPPPAIITVPPGGPGGAAITLPAGDSSSQVVIQTGAPGSAVPDEVQRLLDDLASGAILLNSSPAGPDGDSVNYAYRDVNGDGVRDLVVIVVAEPAGQGDPAAVESAGEAVQAIGINLDALVQSLNANPNAPLVNSAFVYTVSQEELDRLDKQ